MKGKHNGERCFVIASGPSMKYMDLSPLRGETVICVNESYKALDWDPDYICIGDRELWPQVKDVYATKSSKIICSSGLNGLVGQGYTGTNLALITKLHRDKTVLDKGFSYDLDYGVHKAWNVIPEIVLPFVCWAGFSECYLLGCDCTNLGYFYSDSTRGTKHQKILHEVFQVHDLISKQPLPTRIFNAGLGGKLSSYPRVDFTSLAKESPKVDTDLMVIGYYTPDCDYRQRAENMKASVERLGLHCFIQERPSKARKEMPKPMPWVLNCAQCGPFIREMMASFPDRRLLYLDADAEMLKMPQMILGLKDIDFAAPILTNEWVNCELQSNTLYFNTTPAARALVNKWCELQEQRNKDVLAAKFQPPYREAWDQRVLQESIAFIPKLAWTPLPWEYGKIDLPKSGRELMQGVKPEDVVIAQHQASRVTKTKI